MLDTLFEAWRISSERGHLEVLSSIQIRVPSGLRGFSAERSWQQIRVHKVSLTQELWKAVKAG